MESEKVLLIDVPYVGEFIPMFERMGLTVLKATSLSRELHEWDGWQKLDQASTLLVFPGQGGQIVFRSLGGGMPGFKSAGVFAKRVWIPGEDPRVHVGRIYPRGFLIGLKDVVIVDDVVSSGKTSQRLRSENTPWIPGAHWHAVSWIRQRAASLRGFADFYAVREFGDRSSKVPINSLSTLLLRPDLAEVYAVRNFGNEASEILGVLSEIRSGRSLSSLQSRLSLQAA